MNTEQRGAMAWRQYVEDVQEWKEEYKRLAEKYVAAVLQKVPELPGGDLTENDTN